jgi:hypothetical protein
MSALSRWVADLIPAFRTRGVAECECPPNAYRFSDPKKCPEHRYLIPLREYFDKNYVLLNDLDGCSRAAYLSNNRRYVYKVPRSKIGVNDNAFEARAYRSRDKVTTKAGYPLGQFLARCRLAACGVLVMEYLEESHPKQPRWGTPERPSYLEFADGGQGGVARDGTFKLFDYSVGVQIGDEEMRVYESV